MKKNGFKLGIFAVLLALGVVVVGCDNDLTEKIDFNGTWKNGNYSLVITGLNYTLLDLGINLSKGTYIKTGETEGTITINQTHNAMGNNGYWREIIWSTSGTWSLSGNTLTLGGMDASIALNGNWIKQ